MRSPGFARRVVGLSRTWRRWGRSDPSDRHEHHNPDADHQAKNRFPSAMRFLI